MCETSSCVAQQKEEEEERLYHGSSDFYFDSVETQVWGYLPKSFMPCAAFQNKNAE